MTQKYAKVNLNNTKLTSREEINRTYITVVLILKNGKHVKGTNDLYAELHNNPTKKLRNKEGVVFSGQDVLKYVPIDDYGEYVKKSLK